MICEICGKRMATDTHHLIYGRGLRDKCDSDNITLEICRPCHTAIHETATAGALSKMLGQAIWEKDRDDARQRFIDRYGRSYL